MAKFVESRSIGISSPPISTASFLNLLAILIPRLIRPKGTLILIAGLLSLVRLILIYLFCFVVPESFRSSSSKSVDFRASKRLKLLLHCEQILIILYKKQVRVFPVHKWVII